MKLDVELFPDNLIELREKRILVQID
jgi:hypothetical protein